MTAIFASSPETIQDNHYYVGIQNIKGLKNTKLKCFKWRPLKVPKCVLFSVLHVIEI